MFRGADIRATLLATLAVAAVVPHLSHAQSPANPAVAQQRYEAGVRLYEEGQLSRALEQLQTSYHAHPSPNSRLYIARALRGLGRLAEAREQYYLTEREAEDRAAAEPRYNETAQAARDEGEALEPQIGRLLIQVEPLTAQSTLHIGERALPRAAVGLAVPVDVGEHAVTVEAPGYLTARTAVKISSGETRSLRLTLTPEPATTAGAASAGPDVESRPHPEEERPHSSLVQVMGWAAMGVAAGGAALFGISYALAETRYAELQRTCGSEPCGTEHTSTIEEGRALQNLTNFSAGISGVAALIGVVLLSISLLDLEPGEGNA